MARIKALILKRIVVFRLLFYGTVVLTTATAVETTREF